MLEQAEQFVSYRRQLTARGIYELPVDLKRNYISLAHSKQDIDDTLTIAQKVLKGMAR